MKIKNIELRMKKALVLISILAYLQIGTLAAQTVKSADDSLKHKIAQMLLIGFRGTELKPTMPIYKDIKELGIGGVILFDFDSPTRTRGRNIASPRQLKSLVASLKAIASVPLLVTIDQEGGMVNRLRPAYGFPPTVTAKHQGRINNPDTTAKYARATAKLLHELGFNLNFAPVVDVDVNPNCPIIGKFGRSFSADPQVVIDNARIWLIEQKKQGVIGCIKHFPGHGSATGDTHLGMVDVTHTWIEEELEPYRVLIAEGIVDVVMTAHVFNAKLDKEYPATMSKKTITGILREQMGFNGVVVTDDLAMDAMVKHYSFDEILLKAIEAGADILCLSNNGREVYDPNIARKAFDSIYKAVKAGKISPERIDESYRRIMKLKEKMQ